MIKHLKYTLCAIAAGLFIMNCSLPKSYEISPRLTHGKYKKIGILVMRMGNLYPETPAPITIDTDYSIRAPKPQSTMGLTSDKVDVCLEDETKIMTMLPGYPAFQKTLTPRVAASFFGNISARIFESAAGILEEKGYQPVDVKTMSKRWREPIQEMRIAEILTLSSPDIDALLVIHYTDVADYYYNAINVVLDSKGFSYLDYTVSMFDTATKERILCYDPFASVLVAKAMINDPEIDQEVLRKIRINDRTIPLGFYNRYDRSKMVSISKFKVSYDLTDDEVIGYALKYFAKGLSYETPSGIKVHWRGLAEMIP